MNSCRCPGCGERIHHEQAMRVGILHARSERRGGPYYTMTCTACAMPLVAEMRIDRPFAVRSIDELRGEPGLLRVLRNFLAAPHGGSAKKPRIPPRPSPKDRREPSKSPHRASKALDGNLARPRVVLVWTPKELALLHRLELPEAIGFEEVRKRYRKFVRENHPDRFLRSSESERIEFERRFVEINTLYRELLVSIDRKTSDHRM